MNDKTFNNYELEMLMLEGKPIRLYPNLLIHKISFSSINDLGYYKYNKIVSVMCLTQELLNSSLKYIDIDIYTYIISLLYHSLKDKNDSEQEDSEQEKSFLDDFLEVLSIIFKDKVKFNSDYGLFEVGDNGILYQDNFDSFQSIIRKRNCFENIEEEQDNPDGERTRQILARRKELRNKIHKNKSDDDQDGITLLDLISIFAESEHMKLEDVFQYDMFQFNNQFNRLKINKDYQVNIRALLAGAKSEDINIQYWISKIKQNND